jgi:streptogramin lyase
MAQTDVFKLDSRLHALNRRRPRGGAMRFATALVLSVLAAVLIGASAGAGTSGKVLELKYPKASPVPTGSQYIKSSATSWLGDVSDLSASASTMYVGTSTGIQRINPRSTSFEPPLIKGTEAADVVATDGTIWASDYDGDEVREVDEASGNVTAKVNLRPASTPEGIVAAAAPEGIVAADGAIWVAEHHGGAVARIDPATKKVVAIVNVGYTGSDGPQGLAYGAGSLWVSVPNIAQVVRIDPTTNKVTAKISTGLEMSPCGNIAVGTTSAWVTGCLDNTWVARISLATNKVVRQIDMHARSIQPVAQGDTAWFLVGRDPGDPSATRQHAYLVQLNSSDRVLHRYDLGSRFTPGGTAIAFGSLWASSFTTPWVARIPLP